MKFRISNDLHVNIDVKVCMENLDANSFIYSYGEMINEFLQFHDENGGDFLEYLKEKTKDPYLNNLLEKLDFTFNEKTNIVTDKEGEYKIQYIMQVGDYIVYLSAYYMWLFNTKTNEKYFYYTD